MDDRQFLDSHPWVAEAREAARAAAEVVEVSGYQSQAARDAEEHGYGGKSYWDYLDKACVESRDHYLRRGDPTRANEMMIRSLSEALQGNDGD